jgi:hypothetical protein
MITSMKKGLVPPGFVAVMLAGKEKLKRQESMFVLAMITAFMITAVFLPGLICPAAANADQVSVAKTGQTTSYAAGDDGDLQKGVAWPDPRFTDNRDGTVTDNLTGLMWAKDANAEGSKTWSSAVDYSNNLTLGNYSDWRLPNIKELLSLFDYSQLDPMLPIDYPFTNVQDYYYWTSTADSRSPTQDAWGVVPYSGNRSSTGHGGHCYVWPVRGESSGPAPVPKTGQTKSYATGDDGDLQKGVTWPNPRFTDNRDGTVTDNLTRLIWLKNARCFGGTWAEALSDCNSLASGICGLMDGSVAGDWRLPNIKELLSLCDYSQFNPTLPSGHPFTHVQDYYGWTSTASAEITSPASFWRVDPIDGNVAAMYNDCSFCVWPVRGPEVVNILPVTGDADGDGIADVDDSCPNDPDNDIDGDGICGDVDNCRSIANADQADADGDGIGDVCDPCPNDPDNDIDGDGISGDVDNCRSKANADQADADGDGIGDVCDSCPNDTDNDIDGDGICGDVDTCPNDPDNDADGDGICADVDNCPNDPDNDADGDGICADVDNCPSIANADQADADGDGIGDVCDICPYIYNDYTEFGDAGELAETAQSTVADNSNCGVELVRINGTLSTADDVDLYKIKVTDRDTFEVSTSESNIWPLGLLIFRTNGDLLWGTDSFQSADPGTIFSVGHIYEGEYLIGICAPCLKPVDTNGNDMFTARTSWDGSLPGPSHTYYFSSSTTTLGGWEPSMTSDGTGGIQVHTGWGSSQETSGDYKITFKGAAFAEKLADAGPDLCIFSQDQNNTVIQGTSTALGPYSWFEDNILLYFASVGDNGECPLDLGTIPILETGFHILTLEVENPQGIICSDDMKLIIEDPEAPSGPEEPGLAPVAKTGQLTSYETGDDGNLTMGVAWPVPRFTDNQDGTVTDNLTGLIWLKNANYFKTGKTWEDALSACAVLSDDGVTLRDGSVPGDWRLPNVNELLSIIDYSVWPIPLPDSHSFYNLYQSCYWTSTTYRYYADRSKAFRVSLNDGSSYGSSKTDRWSVWPVRGVADGPAPVAKTGQTEYYGCHDDGILKKGVKWPDPRFTDNQDGTVTDNLTGLIWLKNANRFNGSMLWSEALNACNNLQDDNVNLTDGSVPGDWRLPNIKELSSLIDYGQSNRVLPQGHPFTRVVGNCYCSSTSSAYRSDYVWGVHIAFGWVYAHNKGYDMWWVWPVRGPEVATNQSPTLAPTGGGTYQIVDPVMLGGSVSDLDGDLVAYEWLEEGEVLFSGEVQTTCGGDPVDLPDHTISNLGLGNHTITLSVNDRTNDPVTSDIDVEVIDTAAPTLAPVPDKTVLWPPNHRMVDIEILANASDNSGGQPNLSATVSSNEPEDGLGDGDIAPDWTEPEIDNGIISLQLRAERSGCGDGRIYTITIIATDDSGDTSSADVEIIVTSENIAD